MHTLPAEAGSEAHATISHSLGHFGGAARVGIWLSTCSSNLSALGLVVWYSGMSYVCQEQRCRPTQHAPCCLDNCSAHQAAAFA